MRFEKITIENFKNVVHGELSFENKRRPDGPSILALYGQNGSGKSALIDCLLAFKLLVVGEPLPRRFADYVNKNAEFARVVYEFNEGNGGREKYEVEFRNNNGTPQLVSETYSSFDHKSKRLKTTFTTKGYDQYGPKAFHDAMSRFNTPTREGQFNKGASLLFSLTSLLNLDERCSIDFDWPYSDIDAYADGDMYVIGTKEAEAIESGELVVAYDYINNHVKYEDGIDTGALFDFDDGLGPGAGWKLKVSTDSSSPSYFPEALCISLEKGWLKDINYLIGQLIPGMKLELATLDTNDELPEQKVDTKQLDLFELMGETDDLKQVYIQSKRGDISIPLSCESRGVQKLVAIAWLLVCVYNDSGVVAVIDEIDSGVFEYLLGEILRTVSEEGEGQLIFTSHNLRPLEVMDKGYIAFTTSNPENRYMRLRNVKATNNLRDFYYRSIYLGGQKESIYEPPSSGELSMAFMMANWRNRISDDDE